MTKRHTLRQKSKGFFRGLFLLNIILVLIAGCGDRKSKDADVKADLVTKAKKEKAFSGVRFTVRNGIVTLNGICPTEKSKTTVESTVKGVYGVTSVVNNLAIGSVIIGTDEQLRESVDSVLKKYPAVQALVTDSAVLLEGQVEGKEAPKLAASIEKLRPKRLENRVVVQ